jgi:hypothetical protein
MQAPRVHGCCGALSRPPGALPKSHSPPSRACIVLTDQTHLTHSDCNWCHMPQSAAWLHAAAATAQAPLETAELVLHICSPRPCLPWVATAHMHGSYTSIHKLGSVHKNVHELHGRLLHGLGGDDIVRLDDTTGGPTRSMSPSSCCMSARWSCSFCCRQLSACCRCSRIITATRACTHPSNSACPMLVSHPVVWHPWRRC